MIPEEFFELLVFLYCLLCATPPFPTLRRAPDTCCWLMYSACALSSCCCVSTVEANMPCVPANAEFSFCVALDLLPLAEGRLIFSRVGEKLLERFAPV